MKTTLIILVFLAGFVVGQIYYNPAFYRAYEAVSDRIEQAEQQKQLTMK